MMASPSGAGAAGGTLEGRSRYWDELGGGASDAAAAGVLSYAVPVTLGVVLLLGVVGNGSVIYTVCKHRRMKNVPNAFVVNVAVSNLLLLFVVSPFVAAYYIFDSWLLGAFVCKLTEATQTFSVALSTLSVTALSIERYCAFASPPRRRRVARRRACVGILVMWILAGVAALPDAMSALVEHKATAGDRTLKRCVTFTEAWGPLYPRIHTIVSGCLLFGVPLILVNVFYMSLGCVVCGKKRRDRRRLARSGSSSAAAAAEMLQMKPSHGQSNGRSNGAAADGGTAARNGGALLLPGSKMGTVSTITRTGTLSGQASGGTLARGEHGGTLARGDKKDSKTSLLQQQRLQQQQTKKRRKTMAKVAVFLCFQFAVFWAPRYAYRGWFYFDAPKGVDESIWGVVRLAGLGAIFLNAALVPFAVISFNRAFRRRLAKYLCCCCSSCGACCCLDDDEDDPMAAAELKRKRGATVCCPCCCWDDGDSDSDDQRDLESDYQTASTYRTHYLDTYDVGGGGGNHSQVAIGGGGGGGASGDVAVYDPRYEYGAVGGGMATEGPYGVRTLSDYAYLHQRNPYDAAHYAEPALLRINPLSSGYLHPAEPQHPYGDSLRYLPTTFHYGGGAADEQQQRQQQQLLPPQQLLQQQQPIPRTAGGAAGGAGGGGGHATENNSGSPADPPPPPAMFDSGDDQAAAAAAGTGAAPGVYI